MAHLDWRETRESVAQQIRPHAKRGSELALEFPPERRDELAAALEAVYCDLKPEAGAFRPELRMDLPIDNNGERVIFWKLREGESRLLLAHPQEQQWVATVALEAEHGRQLVARLRALGPGESLRLSELGVTSGLSNTELSLALRPGLNPRLNPGPK